MVGMMDLYPSRGWSSDSLSSLSMGFAAAAHSAISSLRLILTRVPG